MSSTSRILSHLFKNSCRECFTKRGLNYQSKGTKTNAIIRYFDYLKSSQGKKALFVGASVFSFGVTVVKLLPQTPLFQKYIQMFYQSYVSSEKVKPVTRMLGEHIINQVVQDMELTQEEANSLKIFVGNLAEPSAFGSFSFGSVMIGCPPFFNIFSKEDVPDMMNLRFGMKLGDDEPDVTVMRSREGKEFRDALYLSDDAKKFAIAREIFWSRHTPVIVPPMLSGLAVSFVYGTCRYINMILPFLHKSFVQRWGIYLGVAFFFYVIHKKSQDFFYNNRICKADELASSISPKYKEGGIEYYGKLLQRNVALRHLIPHSRGRRIYNLKGNPVSPLFGSKLTISQRRRLIEDLQNVS